jgi:hypothetical protein
LTLSDILRYSPDIDEVLMSDGPHKSLPMKPKWRSVAERAYNPAFGIDEISTAMLPALAGDCHDEMSPRFVESLRSLCEHHETTLPHINDLSERVENLRREAGNGMGRRVLEHVERFAAKEGVTINTAVNAIECAGAERLAKSNRQIEEHTLRNGNVPRANDVRSRLEQATATTALTSLARQVLRLEDTGTARSSAKRDGLDEGPGIR